MSGQDRRAGVIAGDDHDVWRELEHAGQGGIEAFQGRHLRGEVAVLSRLVRVLVVDEKEIVAVPVLAQRGDLVAERGPRLQDFHADEAREPAVHRVGGNRSGPKAEHAGELRQVWELVEAA